MRRLVAVLMVGWIANGLAAEVERAEINFDGTGYRYLFSATLAATPDAVRRIVTDYDRLARLNDEIISSAVLVRYDERRLKRRLLMRHCLLLYCFKLDFVEQVDIRANGEIATEIVPAESTFYRGQAVWRIEAVGADHTRITVEATQEPKFWIPPLIGPLLMKASFMSEVQQTNDAIERLARDEPLQ